jgi:hypothetical protein
MVGLWKIFFPEKRLKYNGSRLPLHPKSSPQKPIHLGRKVFTKISSAKKRIVESNKEVHVSLS